MTDIDTDWEIVPFATVLQQIQKGTAASRASEALADLVAAVIGTGKPGAMTLTIKVEPMVKGGSEDGSLILTAVVASKTPRDDSSGVFFGTERGTLTRTDPRQLEIPGTRGPVSLVGSGERSR
jgi:hypothetical protein